MGNEDDTDKFLDQIGRATGKKSKGLCLAKYWTKDRKGNRVQRTCIKKKGHWGGHK